MLQDESIEAVASYLEVTLAGQDFAANRKILAERINEWILNDFQKLIAVLYRLDVSEEKLKTLLRDNSHSDAGIIITDLIIERQLQKIKSRQQFRAPDVDIDENDKW
jgi:hypothetical protein